jgi:hypothetical protein
MKTLRILPAAALLIALGTSGAALAQSGQNDADMQKMMEMIQPGPEHQMMTKMVGKWNSTGKMWMDPAAPPMESTGVMEYASTLDGRYFLGDYKGNWMGMPFEGRSVDGFDRFAKEYFSYWYDNMGTGMMAMRGTASADGKIITMNGSAFDPMVGANVMFKAVTTWVNDNTIKYEMFSLKGGKEIKSMEMVYTRM